MADFTYRGIHSSKFGCHYVPSAVDRGSDMPVYEVEE